MVFSVSSLRRAVTVSTLTAAIVVSPLLGAIVQALPGINGAGASFPDLLYQEYIKVYQTKTGNKVTYQAIGSGGGIRQTIAGAVKFGGSDAAMTDAQMSEGEAGKRGILLIPTAGGSVVPVFKLSGVSNLNLSREALAGIFSGKISKWNDAKIASANPGVSLPDKKINLVVRSDGSGTTFIFTNHLSAIDPYFKGRVGVGTAPKWPGDPQKSRGNAGVAATVQKLEGSIGYVEYAFAKQSNLSVASIQNASGQYVQPSLQGTNDAISAISFPDNFRVFDGNPKQGYPITGLTWMMVYKKYPKEEAEAVKAWMRWVLTDGQDLNNGKEFARINPSVTQRALQQVDSIVGE
jgi:phosphate transport system substrate-binding protein